MKARQRSSGSPLRRRAGSASATLVGLALLLSACGGTSKSSGSASTPSPGTSSASAPASAAVAKDAAIAASVPADIKAKGKLTFATEGTYPPFELFEADNKTLTGVDPELARAVSAVMGLQAEFVNTKFDSIIPGLQARRFDVGMASFGDTPAREKIVDFVTYFKGGSTILVPKGNPKGLAITSLCGTRLAVQKGSTYESDVVPGLIKTCTTAGKPPINVSIFPDAPSTVLAVSSNRADSTISDLAPLAYVAAQSKGKFDVLEQQYQTIPWGATMLKGSPLAQPFRAAMQKLMDSGAYTAVLTKWGVTSGAIKTSKVNDAAAG